MSTTPPNPPENWLEKARRKLLSGGSKPDTGKIAASGSPGNEPVNTDGPSSSPIQSRDTLGWIKIEPVRVQINVTPGSSPVQGSATPSAPPAPKESTTCIRIEAAKDLPPPGEKSKGKADCFEDLAFTPRNYAIESLVAEGGMGVIHRAMDLNTERAVAMKVLRDDKPLSRQDVLRFVQEAQVNAQLEHPNVVPVYELGQDASNKPYYTMKLVHGVTLETILEDIKRGDAKTLAQFPLAALLTIFEKVCDAVAFAHSKGIVHRDLKPANVMVGEYGEVLVLDWGMAKILGKEPSTEPVTESPSAFVGGKAKDSNLTFGFLLGTPSFMAPEQAENLPVDTRADIYALGGILFNILTLHPPHEDAEVYEMLENIKKGRISAPSTYNPPSAPRWFGRILQSKKEVPGHTSLSHCPGEQIPQVLSLVAMKALALRPTDRYPDVRSLQKDVQAYQRGFITSVEEAGLMKQFLLLARRHKTETALVAAIALIVVVFTLRLFFAERARFQALQVQLETEKQRLALIEKERIETKREWRLVFADDFTDPQVTNRWDIITRGGKWEVRNGEFHFWDGKPFWARLKKPVPGDVRVEFDIRQEGDYLCDVTCLLGALPMTSHTEPLAGGYLFQYGGFGNTQIMLRRPNGLLWNRQESPLVRGKRYHVEAEKAGGQLKLVVDGNVVFNVEDHEPLIGAEHAGVGLYGFQADTYCSHVRVYQLDAPIKADLLETARDFMVQGDYSTAASLCRQVVQAATDPSRRRHAQEELDRATRMLRLPEELPGIRTQLKKIWPKAVVDIAEDGLSVDIPSSGIRDLTPLKGLPIRALDCRYNQIASLEPLRGMGLTSLTCSDNQLTSLDPLRGMPLHYLLCGNNQIASLEPLRGMPLRYLLCGNNRIASLEPLRGMALNAIFFGHNQVDDLDPLRGMPMESLEFGHNRVSSLEPLRGMPLSTLMCTENRFQSLEPVRGILFAGLDCSGNPITSLEPLDRLSAPGCWLDCSRTPLRTLEPLVSQPPSVFVFDIDSLPPEEVKRLRDQWSQPRFANYLSKLNTLLAFKENDTQGLIRLSREFSGHHYLFIPSTQPSHNF
jgi:serine/threonine protein kinase